MSEQTPVELLQKCIDDIDNGLWICGELERWKGPMGGTNSKHMGCAIGLLSINSGHVIKEGKFSYARYLNDGEDNAPKEAKQAAKYLSDAIPEEEKGYPESERFIDIEGNVIEYNDGTCETPQQAREWFVNALELAKKEENIPS